MAKEILNKSVLEKILASAEEKRGNKSIDIPADYSIANALQAAWFKINRITVGFGENKKNALEICDNDSIQKALFEMVTEGMNPAKHQCCFIVHGTSLDYQREYQGDIALAKRYSGVQSVASGIVREGDVFETYTGQYGIEKLIPFKREMFHNSDKKIVGAYCVVVDSDGIERLTKMTREQITKSWDFSKKKTFKGYVAGTMNDTQTDFEDQMCEKTVIRRACKPYINSSNDERIIEEREDETPRLQSPKSIRDILPEPKTLAIAPTDVKQIEAPIQQQSEEPVPDWGNVD